MDRLESGIEELAAASRYCTSSFGTAALYRARCELDGAEQALPCKRLRRKENVSVVHFELPSAPKSAIAADTKNRNNVNMLDRRFNIAPPPKTAVAGRRSLASSPDARRVIKSCLSRSRPSIYGGDGGAQ